MGLLYLYITYSPIPVAARSKVCVCGRLLAGIVGSNFAGVMRMLCVAGKGLYVGLIIRPEESRRVWCI
jgi:hypothetical protein